MPKLVDEETRKRPTSLSLPAAQIFLLEEIERVCKRQEIKPADEHIKAIEHCGQQLGIDTKSKEYKEHYEQWLRQKKWDGKEPKSVARNTR